MYSSERYHTLLIYGCRGNVSRIKTPLKCGTFNSRTYVGSSIFVNGSSGISMLNTLIVNRPSVELEYECALDILEVCFYFCASYQPYQSLASILAQATPYTTCLYDKEKLYTPKGKSDISRLIEVDIQLLGLTNKQDEFNYEFRPSWCF